MHFTGRTLTFDNDDGTNRQVVIGKYCNSGDWLDVRPEPNNPHSRNALGLWVHGGLIFRSWHQVGYIPQDDADRLRRRLDEGCRITARISEVVGGEDGLNYGLRIDVFVHEPQRQAVSEKKPPSDHLETAQPVVDPVQLLSPDLISCLSKFKKFGLLAIGEGLAFIGLGWLIQRLAGRPSDIFHLGVFISIVGFGVFLIGVFGSFGDAQHRKG